VVSVIWIPCGIIYGQGGKGYVEDLCEYLPEDRKSQEDELFGSKVCLPSARMRAGRGYLCNNWLYLGNAEVLSIILRR